MCSPVELSARDSAILDNLRNTVDNYDAHVDDLNKQLELAKFSLDRRRDTINKYRNKLTELEKTVFAPYTSTK